MAGKIIQHAYHGEIIYVRRIEHDLLILGETHVKYVPRGDGSYKYTIWPRYKFFQP